MLSRLPPEVVTNHIFPFLSVNDLLRLRRVCKVFKDLAEEYLRVYGASKRVVRINESLNEMSTFLALTYPLDLTRFDLWNRDNSSWGREDMQTFLRLYGGKITHLEISILVVPIESTAAIQFFEGLRKLKELKIKLLWGPPASQYYSDEEQGSEDEAPADLNLPSTFKRLQHLHVKRRGTCRKSQLFTFIDQCATHLERYIHPWEYSPQALERVRRIVERRHRENPGAPNLQFFDLQDLMHPRYHEYAMSFHRLVTTCSAHGVKLQNVDAYLIEEMMRLDIPDWELREARISRCVVSIRDLTKSVFRLELPFLEQINIMTSECSMPEGDFEAQPWGSLKELEVCVNSEHLGAHGDGEGVLVSRLFEFLFHGIRRENLESLHLDFCSSGLPHPNMRNVCSSCPNLKTLRIEKWPGSNRDIVLLWGKLPLLEDVTFFFCDTLGDAAFIGDDDARPTIWKATRLKSLSLEKMPGITEALFKSALRHMPLRTLYLGSTWASDSGSSFTLAGLESLLTGKLAETIENFPLKGRIQLEGVTDAQLAELEGKFRSAQMNTFVLDVD